MYIDELNQKYSSYSTVANKNVSNKKDILSQNTSNAPRKIKLRWLLAVSSIPLFGIFTAFGIAPKTKVVQVPTQTIAHVVTIPATTQLTAPTNHIFHYKAVVKSGDSLHDVTNQLNIADKNAIQFIRDNVIQHAANKKLSRGQTLEASVDHAGKLLWLQYNYSEGHSVKVKRDSNNQLVAKLVTLPLETRTVLKSATIKHSLFASTDQAGIPDAIAMQIIKIFESEINFHKDLRKGDQFKVIYGASFYKGKLVKPGHIHAIEFTNKNKTLTAIAFTNKKNEIKYYTPKGKSLSKSFLRSPLAFTRVTSGFSLGRYHPVLQRIRAHKGVDMAAPTGTKIRAAGDAIVQFAGWKGGYGRIVILKHSRGVKTKYGHLSRFAKGIKKGRKVSQGTVIGYVGKSGLATGPHLHYEFLQNGKHRDPMKVALPKGQLVSAAQKRAFMKVSDMQLKKMQLLRNTNIAALE